MASVVLRLMQAARRPACHLARSYSVAASDIHRSPIFPVEELVRRRNDIADGLPRDSVLIVPAAGVAHCAEDVPYRFRQCSDYLYLTGLHEPDGVLAIRTHSNPHSHVCMLAVLPKDAKEELWNGPRLGTSLASQHSGIDAVVSTDELHSMLQPLTMGAKHVFFGPKPPYHSFAFSNVFHTLQQLARQHTDTHARVDQPKSARGCIDRARLCKSEREIEAMRKAARIGTAAVKTAMKVCASYIDHENDTARSSSENGATAGKTDSGSEHKGAAATTRRKAVPEHHLDSWLEHTVRIKGASLLAYPPVVAGGSRANIIHYIANNNDVLDGELVLVDAGADYEGYVSDITRTWPVNGRFSEPQAELYQSLLDVQERLLQEVSMPTSLHDLHSVSDRLLTEAALKLGLLSPASTESARSRLMRVLYPHSVGHYLGMDVHDTPSIPGSTRFKPGMCITIEPGLYVPEKASEFPSRFRGIGMRLEDDVVFDAVTGAPECITCLCPKTIEDIEKTVQSGAT